MRKEKAKKEEAGKEKELVRAAVGPSDPTAAPPAVVGLRQALLRHSGPHAKHTLNRES